MALRIPACAAAVRRTLRKATAVSALLLAASCLGKYELTDVTVGCAEGGEALVVGFTTEPSIEEIRKRRSVVGLTMAPCRADDCKPSDVDRREEVFPYRDDYSHPSDYQAYFRWEDGRLPRANEAFMIWLHGGSMALPTKRSNVVRYRAVGRCEFAEVMD